MTVPAGSSVPGAAASTCSRCQASVPAGARFCPGCGRRLGAPAESGRRVSDAPPHLAERMRTGAAAIEGERKQVTVLFADVKGSMELLADRDPEDASRLLEDVLAQMVEAVHRYEGTVNQVMGDGVMALFGAPIAHEDHAVRACYAALRMQERIATHAEMLLRTQGVALAVRIGLHSGEVVLRSVGSDLHAADVVRPGYTAVGQTVHLAARMEQLARPGSILATADTIGLAGPRVRARPLGPLPVRGLPAPVEAFEVVGAGTSAGRGLGGRITPFVGREHEMARLRAALEAVVGGAGAVVAVTGEAGVGKSRLLAELVALARARGCVVLETAAVSYGRAMAHRPGVELTRQYFGVEAGDDARTIEYKVTGRMVALDPALEEMVPAILWLLRGLREGHPFHALDPERRRRRAVEAQIALIARQAEREPLFMLLEDLQWIDSETQAALEELARRIPPRTLLALSYRPEYDDAWARDGMTLTLRLGALSEESARVLLATLVGLGPDLPTLTPLVLARADGNPLFLEECVRSLVETGVLVGERGEYRLAHHVTAIQVPASVRALIEARIDRLTAADKHILQCAAVIGEEVSGALLEEVADLPSPVVEGALADLRAAELLREAALFPEREYAFTHSLVHDVAHDSLLLDRRRLLHARVLAAMEAGGSGRAPVERLAHHALHGEAWPRAVAYLREAGRQALDRVAGREAVGFLEQALAALARLPAAAESRALAVDIRHDLYNALVPLGEHTRILEILRDAETVAIETGDERRLARTLSLLANGLWERGHTEEAMEAGRRTLEIAERLDDFDLQVTGNFSLGGAARARGEYRRAEAYLRPNIERLVGPLAQARLGLTGLAAVLSRDHLAWTLAELGEFDEAERLGEESVALAQAAGHAFSLAHAHLGLGGALLRRGRMGEALTVLERGVALTKDAPALFAPMAMDLGLIYGLSGRTAHAVELGERGVERARRTGRLGRLSLLVTHLGEIYLLAGRLGDARRQASTALELALAQGERGNQVYALQLLGHIAAEPEDGDLELAQARYAEAATLAETLEMRPLLARCLLGLGRVGRRTTDPRAAQHLERAATLFRELGMTFWLDRLGLDRVGSTVV